MVAAKLSVLMLLSVDSAACLVVGNSLMRRISQRNAHSPVMAVSVLQLFSRATTLASAQHTHPCAPFARTPGARGGLFIPRRARSRRHASLSLLSQERRVVVTGMGVISCLGNTLDDVSKSLHECKSGITKNEKYMEIGMKSHICGRPDIMTEELIDRKQIRFMGMNCRYAYLAMEQAIEDSRLTPEQIATPRVGGILGQGGTSVLDIAETLDAVNAGKNRRIGPYRVTRSMGSTVSAVLSTAFKLQGVSYSISSACSTGAHCIGVGMEQIQLGKQDICFCGAGEAEDWGFSVMFDSMGALSTKYNDSRRPHRARLIRAVMAS